MMISYEWKTQVSLDAFGSLKTSPGGAREREKEYVQHFLLFCFYLKMKMAQYVIWANKLLGSDPGLMGQNTEGALVVATGT